jgi:uncharacterized protein with ParB-like and HNH nuclease domain
MEHQIKGYADDAESMGMTFELDPDFQRNHVWSREKQVRFVEFILRGGTSALNIYFNCPGWQACSHVEGGRFVLVDGKQRLEAVRAFLRGDFPVCGHYFAEFTDRLPLHARFSVHINNLPTDAEVLQWYLDLNDGGVVHTTEEIARVRAMLEAEKAREKTA